MLYANLKIAIKKNVLLDYGFMKKQNSINYFNKNIIYLVLI